MQKNPHKIRIDINYLSDVIITERLFTNSLKYTMYTIKLILFIFLNNFIASSITIFYIYINYKALANESLLLTIFVLLIYSINYIMFFTYKQSASLAWICSLLQVNNYSILSVYPTNNKLIFIFTIKHKNQLKQITSTEILTLKFIKKYILTNSILYTILISIIHYTTFISEIDAIHRIQTIVVFSSFAFSPCIYAKIITKASPCSSRIFSLPCIKYISKTPYEYKQTIKTCIKNKHYHFYDKI